MRETNSTNNNMIIIEKPNAKHEFLRFQIGEIVIRPEQKPIYGDLGKVVDTQDTKFSTEVFLLKGCGSTLKEAEVMLIK
jgi:hypothetical protein